MNDDWSQVIGALAEIPIAAVLLYAYHRSSKALEDQREHAQKREERLLEMIEKYCTRKPDRGDEPGGLTP